MNSSRPPTCDPSAFVRLSRTSSPQVRLFCFPYAGATASTFAKWPSGLPPQVEVQALEPPGHARRFTEPVFDRLAPLLQYVTGEILPYLDRPFALFGHSMGALVAFELARSLQNEHRITPCHLFVSGRPAPQVRCSTPFYDWPDREFIDEVIRLGGIPEQIAEHPDILQLFTPILKADFAVSQTYIYRPTRKLTCPLTVFGGANDHSVSRLDLDLWAEHTNYAPPSIHILNGGHLFIDSSQSAVLQVISSELGRMC